MFESYTFYSLLCKNHVKSLQNWLKFRIFVRRKDQKTMKITIINCERTAGAPLPYFHHPERDGRRTRQANDKMGYERKRNSKGSVFKVEEI